jgi:hypothetical protein
MPARVHMEEAGEVHQYEKEIPKLLTHFLRF